jgi:hypothetical protein
MTDMAQDPSDWQGGQSRAERRISRGTVTDHRSRSAIGIRRWRVGFVIVKQHPDLTERSHSIN